LAPNGVCVCVIRLPTRPIPGATLSFFFLLLVAIALIDQIDTRHTHTQQGAAAASTGNEIHYLHFSLFFLVFNTYFLFPFRFVVAATAACFEGVAAEKEALVRHRNNAITQQRMVQRSERVMANNL